MTVILSQQIGNEGRRRTCSGTCHTAKKDKCACICGGKYHGIAREGGKGPKSVEEAERMAREAPVKVFPIEQTDKILASSMKLEDLVGKRIRATREFSGVPAGTEGTVVEVYGIGARHRGVTVEWEKPLAAWTGKKLRDGFGRDDDFDETQWLEVVSLKLEIKEELRTEHGATDDVAERGLEQPVREEPT